MNEIMYENNDMVLAASLWAAENDRKEEGGLIWIQLHEAGQPGTPLNAPFPVVISNLPEKTRVQGDSTDGLHAWCSQDVFVTWIDETG